MKKTVLAVTIMGIVVTAKADATLYGVLDVGIATAAHQYNGDPTLGTTINVQTPTAAPNTFTGMVNGALSSSRWGIRGSEDLGNGLKAIYALESGLCVQSGSLCSNAQALANNAGGKTNNASASSIDGQLFSRQAWVGLASTTLGKLTFGRNYSLGADVFGDRGYGPVQNAPLFTPLGYSGTLGGSGGETEYLRQDNSVKYTHQVGNLNYGLLYKFGNVAGSTSAGTGWGVGAGYEADRFGVQAVYQKTNDAVAGSATASATNVGKVNATLMNIKGWVLAAKYQFSDSLGGKLGYQRFTQSTPSDPTQIPTSYYGFGVVTAYIMGPNQSVSIWDAGLDYQATANLKLSGGYFVVSYDSCAANPAANTAPTGYTWAKQGNCGGNINYVSLLADYDFSKRTDVYVGGMSTQPGGALSSNANNTVLVVGMRHRF